MALHVQVLDAVADYIRDLRLAHDPYLHIAKRFNEEESLSDNTIYICRAPERETPGTIGANEIGFPAVIYMVQGTFGDARENEEIISEWRDIIYDAFHLKREPIEDITEDRDATVTPIICKVDFGADFLDEFWQKRWDVNHMQIICYMRRVRT